jgi:hypothetical protein
MSTIFFHPDYTVGTGISPVLSSYQKDSRALTTGKDFPLSRDHLAPKIGSNLIDN